MKKRWKQIIEQFPNLDITNLDYDFDDVSQYNPGSILPIAIFYKNGEEIIRLNGEKDYSEILAVLEENNV